MSDGRSSQGRGTRARARCQRDYLDRDYLQHRLLDLDRYLYLCSAFGIRAARPDTNLPVAALVSHPADKVVGQSWLEPRNRGKHQQPAMIYISGDVLLWLLHFPYSDSVFFSTNGFPIM